MNVEVEIYLNNIIKFFKQNPHDLLTLIPKEKEEDFYIQIRNIALSNIQDGRDATLTQQQMIDICREINVGSLKKPYDFPYLDSKFGPICLN